MPEKDRNRTQIEMQIKCLNHKAVPSFHAEDFNNLNVFLEKKQAECRRKTTEGYVGLSPLSFSLTDHVG